MVRPIMVSGAPYYEQIPNEARGINKSFSLEAIPYQL